MGLDWRGPGQPKAVRTPGQNGKRDRAGVWGARTGQRPGVAGLRKTGALFRALRNRWPHVQAQAPVIPGTLDNCRIDDSKIVRAALRGWGGRSRLHFLPPSCPNDTERERVGQDVQANGTGNPTCRTRTALRREVRYDLRKRNRRLRKNGGGRSPTEAAA
jgi:hypothetical protein